VDLLLAHAYFLADDRQEQSVMKPYPPMGLMYISSHLKAKGFDVGLFDGTFRSTSDFTDLLERARPPVVGFYCNLMTKRSVLGLIGHCRRAGAAVVVGGPEPANYPERYLEHGADVVAIGEGERTLEELLPALRAGGRAADLAGVPGLVYRGEDGEIVRTPPRPLIPDLDTQPLPDRDAVDLDRYLQTWRRHHGRGSLSLLTARGCPFTCTWCSRSVFGGTHRRRAPERVADEVEGLRDRYAPDQLWYTDDVFTIHAGWTLKYAAEMHRRGLRVPFECISRAERITDEVADALESLGCFRLWIGSESGSQPVLDAMDRRVTVEKVQETARRLKRRGIQVGMFIMLGYPGERFEDLQATVTHLKRAAPDVFLTTVAYPIRGTTFYAQVEPDILARAPWENRTDRDLTIRGRHTPRYYQFARRWMASEVGRDRHWRNGEYLRATSAAAKAGVARIGMAATSRQREA
jgi:radical SAM superfamily enzyme YgiQ (UPF0313 family)